MLYYNIYYLLVYYSKDERIRELYPLWSNKHEVRRCRAHTMYITTYVIIKHVTRIIVQTYHKPMIDNTIYILPFALHM